jgi:tRNA(Arg) A34 adenosine deaminase TadA
MVDHQTYLLRAVEVSKQAVLDGNHPFGALLVDESGAVLLEQGNVEVTSRDCTGHAETTLMRRSSQNYPKDFLATCTMYTTAEPCAMCAGAIYWGNVGRLVYGISERQLLAETGDDPRNPTLSLDCRTVFRAGQKPIEVIGPVPEVAAAVLAPHRTYWTQQS